MSNRHVHELRRALHLHSEIERLRMENSQLLEQAALRERSNLEADMQAIMLINNELKAEIERLRELKTPASRELLNVTKGCLDDAEAELERLRAELDEWRHCARYDPLMSGRQFKGWDRSQMDRCRKQFLDDKT